MISQKYHNERALYQARYLGVDAIAYNAHTPRGASWLRNRARECLARVKLIIDVARGLNPDVRFGRIPSVDILPKSS
ncbi:MAG: hypothetical protein LIO91_05905 [Bacteroidales bacterium]|nr:hypothetical protein [Bacteroidales bacterium]